MSKTTKKAAIETAKKSIYIPVECDFTAFKETLREVANLSRSFAKNRKS